VVVQEQVPNRAHGVADITVPDGKSVTVPLEIGCRVRRNTQSTRPAARWHTAGA
jgi:hypothetical protein